jgi:DNA-binding IclR family transcriptional regulator
MSEEIKKTNPNYLIDSLVDACSVLKKMMEDLSPSKYYTISELSKLFDGLSDNKIYRIIKSFEHINWVEKHPQQKAYKVGHDLLYLSHNYFRKLEKEHMKIVDEINGFRVNY